MLVLLAVLLVFSGMYTVQAKKTTEQKIEETTDEIEKLREQTEHAKAALDAAKQTQSAAGAKLDELNKQLGEVEQTLADIDRRIGEKNEMLDQTRAELADMQKKQQERYEQMKIRIRFMYENADRSLLDALLGAHSISEFLNRAEYFSQIVSYDRAQLEEYAALMTALTEKEADFAAQKEELLALQEEQEAQKEQLSVLVSEAREDLKAAGLDVSDAKDALTDLDSQLEQQETYQKKLEAQLAYEEELERQKAAEDKARMEEIRRQEEELRKKREEEERRRQEAAENGEEPEGSDTPPASAEDLELLACIIQCEAEGEPYEGKLAVGSVVMNRVASSSFPNTVMGVIYQSGQFSPVASGRMAARLAAGANSECYRAAQEVLDGNITVPYLYFRRNNGTIDGYVIGNHVFY